MNLVVMNTKINKHNKTNTVKYVQKHNLQPCVRMCLHTELSTELYEAKNPVFNLLNRTLGNSNLNIFWQHFTNSISVVLNNLINKMLSYRRETVLQSEL